MNNNGDDHGNYESGDDGERGVLAWWASDATLARHPPLPSGQMVHMGQPTSVTSVGAKNPKNPHLSSLQCIGSNVYSFYYLVRTVCKQYAVQTSALGLFMKPHIHPGATLCSPKSGCLGLIRSVAKAAQNHS